MPCPNHPRRSAQCGCFTLCSECRSTHPQTCGCAQKAREERERQENEKEHDKEHNVMEDVATVKKRLDELEQNIERVQETAACVKKMMHRDVEAEDIEEPPPTPEIKPERADNIDIPAETIIEKLNEALITEQMLREKQIEAKVAQEEQMLEKLNKSYSEKMLALKAEAARIAAEKEILEQEIAERQKKVEVIEQREEIKKKIKKIKKQVKEAEETAKWDKLSKGQSASSIRSKSTSRKASSKIR